MTDGETGCPVEPEDARAVAETIISLLDDAPRAEAMGSRGCSRIKEQFSVDEMTGKYLELYEMCRHPR